MNNQKDYATMERYSLKKEPTTFKRVKITNPVDAEKVSRQYFSDDIQIYESMFLLLLNRANEVTGYVKISQGGIVGTVVDVRLIAKYAIESLSSGVILVHNHPSGNVKPSDQDLRITKKVPDGLKLLDVQLLDHLILTADSFTSFSNEGLI